MALKDYYSEFIEGQEWHHCLYHLDSKSLIIHLIWKIFGQQMKKGNAVTSAGKMVVFDFWSWMQICTWNGVDIFGLAQYRGKICEYQIMLFIYHIMGWRSFRSSKLHLCWFFLISLNSQAILLVISICNYTGQSIGYIYL